MGSHQVCAQKIAEIENRVVRECLKDLFGFELENENSQKVRYSDFYEKTIASYARDWKPEAVDAE